jgi:polysaccharide biosynthesis transport protein
MSNSTTLMPRSDARMARSMASEIVFDPVASVSVSALLRLLRRNLWWVCLATAGMIALAAVVLHFIPPRFQAEAVLQVTQPRPDVPSDSSVEQRNTIDDLAVNSEIDAILAVPVLNGVIKKLQLDRDPEFNPILAAKMPSKLWAPLAVTWDALRGLEARIKSYLSPGATPPPDLEHRLVEQELRRALSVSVRSRSRNIIVQATSESPEKAAAIANAIASAFLQNRLNTKVAYMKQVTGWLNNRLAELRGKMTQSEANVQSLRTNLGQYQGMTTTLLSEQLSQITRQLIDAQAEQSVVQSKFEQIERLSRPNQEIGAADSVLASPLVRSLREQRTRLVAQRSEELTRLGPKNPDVISVNSQIAQVDGAIKAEIARLSKNAGDQLKVLNSRVAALRQAKQDLEKRIDVQNAGLVNVEQLQLDADTDRQTYEAFAIYHDKMAGLDAILQPEAELLSQATAPISPSYPRQLLILAAVALGTLFLSLAFVFLREHMDERFHSSQDIGAILGLPLLALIPRIRGRLRPEAYLSQAPRSSLGEALRYLYAELDHGPTLKAPLKVLLSSSLQGEGKTTTSAMLAREATANGRKTLLINLDMRLGGATEVSHSAAKGQLQTLQNAEQLFEPSFDVEPDTGLTRLSFRTSLHEPFKLLYTQHFWRQLSEITSDYEFVVIDSPPILSVPDAKIIAAFADKTVFLVRWASTKHHTASEGLRHFRTIEAEISGVVLTHVDAKKYASYDSDYVGSRAKYYAA